MFSPDGPRENVSRAPLWLSTGLHGVYYCASKLPVQHVATDNAAWHNVKQIHVY